MTTLPDETFPARHGDSAAAPLADAPAPDDERAPGQESPATDNVPDTAEEKSDAGTDRARPREVGGQAGPEPTRYGDWEKKGRCTDF